MKLQDGMPMGTMIESRLTGMTLVRLRWCWVNLNNSVGRYDEDLIWEEWKITHLPQEYKERYRIVINGENHDFESLDEASDFADGLYKQFGIVVGIEQIND